MSEVAKEQARDLFRSVLRDVGFFGEFRIALGHLQQGEYPYMWLAARTLGVPEARVLVTDRRILVFRVRLFGASALPIVGDYCLQTLSGAPVLEHAGQRASLTAPFGVAAHPSLVLGGVSSDLAGQLSTFLGLPAEQRTLAAERPALRGPLEETQLGDVHVAESPGSRSPSKEDGSGGPLPEARLRVPDVHLSKALKANRQSLPQGAQDEAGSAVGQISKEHAREIFKSVVRNVGFFGEFRIALRHLGQGEFPHMWLSAEIRDLPEARILLTQKRLLVFRVKLVGTPRLPLVASYDLRAPGGARGTRESGGRASLMITPDEPAGSLVALNGLSPELAGQITSFLALPENERAAVAQRRRRGIPGLQSAHEVPTCDGEALSDSRLEAGQPGETKSREPGLSAPSGIGGWLIAPAIGVILSPILLLGQFWSDLDATATAGYKAAASLNPTLRANTTIWLTGSAVVCVLWVVLAISFYRKRRSAPTLFILASWLSLILNVFGLTWLSNPSADAAASAWPRVMGGVAAAAVWSLYFMYSKRVKATFVQ